jgi:hypothetical protein
LKWRFSKWTGLLVNCLYEKSWIFIMKIHTENPRNPSKICLWIAFNEFFSSFPNILSKRLPFSLAGRGVFLSNPFLTRRFEGSKADNEINDVRHQKFLLHNWIIKKLNLLSRIAFIHASYCLISIFLSIQSSLGVTTSVIPQQQL